MHLNFICLLSGAKTNINISLTARCSNKGFLLHYCLVTACAGLKICVQEVDKTCSFCSCHMAGGLTQLIDIKKLNLKTLCLVQSEQEKKMLY